jgi:hypothetical protein
VPELLYLSNYSRHRTACIGMTADHHSTAEERRPDERLDWDCRDPGVRDLLHRVSARYTRPARSTFACEFSIGGNSAFCVHAVDSRRTRM